jgi:trimeric autotransporter adhesin
MHSRLRPKLTYSNVIATIALFIALGGAAVAAGLPKKSVGPKQLKRGAVTTAAIRKAAVTSGKIAPKAVVAGKLGPNAVLPGNIVNGAITSAKIGAGAVIAASIKNGVVTTNKLANEAVTATKLGKGSVTPAKLSEDFGPVLGTLKSGQTLRGVFDLGSVAATAGDSTRSALSYQFPLLNAPAVTVLLPGQTTANCGGLGGGAAQTPQATAGNLCVYVTEATNLEDGAAGLTAENNTRLGFGLVAKAKEGGAGKSFHALGQWAVTAP